MKILCCHIACQHAFIANLKNLAGRARLLVILLFGLLAIPAFAQLQWSSYNNTGGLVTTNVASGGDAGYGGSVTFTIPASTARVFLTKTFVPISIASASAATKVNFTMNASGGLYPTSTGRILGMGMLNDVGAATELNDTGYWVDFNTGNPSFELFFRPSTVTTFFQYDSTDKLGTGKTATGYPSNSVPYGMQFQLNMNSGASSISIGTSASTFAACGAGMTNGNGSVNELAYSSGNPLTTLPTTTFNEFAFMFNNTSNQPVTVTLSGITLVPANAEITSQPQPASGAVGTTQTFTVVINTNAVTPVGYQWYETNSFGVVALTDGTANGGSTVSGSATSGSTAFTNTVTFSNIQLADAGNVFVVITNAYGAVTSSPAMLSVTASDTAPSITAISPVSSVIVAGSGTNVTVTATASPAPAYFWYDNNNNLLQAGSSFTLSLANLQLANQGTYSVTASNYLGTASTNFTVTVVVPPCIAQQPTNVLVNVGDPVNFFVVEGGCAVPPPTYQWYKNGNAISGATATNYSIPSVALTDIAYYSVVISNAAGTVTSANAKLAIYSTTMTGAPLLPANNATGLCVDTYYEMNFNQPVTIGNAGKIYIYDTTNTSTPVDTIDMTLNNARGVQARSLFPGDSQAFNYYPVVANGNMAIIYPHSGKLTTNQTYYVTMDPGVIVDANGAYYPGFSSSSIWQFTTKATGPANPLSLVVDQSGSGDFVTVQGAVDSIPSANSTYTLVNIHNGNYFEIVDVAGKNNITFRGQSRNGTVVGYPNNANIAPGGTTHARMAFKIDANNIAIENLTVSNSTPQGGSQAEALMIESGANKFILNNAEIDSRQDTILANVNSSQGYFYNSLVTGNYDYIWGGGNLFFTNCTFVTIPGASQDNFSAPRTDNGATGNWPGYSGLLVSNGFSFVRCQLIRQAGALSCTMADGNGSPNGLAAWINCNLDTDTIGYTNALSGAYTTEVFWEYGCSNLANTVALNNSANPFIGFTQLNNGDPRLLAAQSSTTWLNGWLPELAPNITSQPVGASVTNGQSATFTAAATGIPDPSYQWLQNGLPITGATGPSYSIASAVRTNGGNYSVIVNNGYGSVTSSVAVLTYVDTAPVAPNFAIGALLGISEVVPIIGGPNTPTDVDGDTLTITGVSPGANGTVTTDGVNATYTATSGTSDSFTYTVSDGFGGNATGTVTVTINTNVAGYNLLSAAPGGSSGNVISFQGVPVYNYALDMATNLTPPVNWVPQATNPANLSGVQTFTNNSPQPQTFYRARQTH